MPEQHLDSQPDDEKKVERDLRGKPIDPQPTTVVNPNPTPPMGGTPPPYSNQ